MGGGLVGWKVGWLVGGGLVGWKVSWLVGGGVVGGGLVGKLVS